MQLQLTERLLPLTLDVSVREGDDLCWCLQLARWQMRAYKALKCLCCLVKWLLKILMHVCKVQLSARLLQTSLWLIFLRVFDIILPWLI